tara:strand:+ start:203 stop:412 length:210 start_codon:yes stop_codon:yes gene_type:complete
MASVDLLKIANDRVNDHLAFLEEEEDDLDAAVLPPPRDRPIDLGVEEVRKQRYRLREATKKHDLETIKK